MSDHPNGHRVVVTGLGAITPLGGIAFISGWLALAVAALKAP